MAGDKLHECNTLHLHILRFTTDINWDDFIQSIAKSSVQKSSVRYVVSDNFSRQ